MKIEEIEYDIPDKAVDEKNFNLEKWRSEKPMDYLFAMYILNKATHSIVKNEVFKTIYKITRLYIPDTLFKYFSLTDDIDLNEQKLITLQQQQLFMSDAKYLNDPFDNKAYFYNHQELMKYEQLAIHEGRMIDDFSLFSKVTSLTANNVNSMPMWAHYSNNHAGFCVSYDMKFNSQLSGCTFPIQYVDQRIDVTSLMDKIAQGTFREIEKQSAEGKKEILLDDLSPVFLVSLLGNLKHISWNYENEFRCTIGATAKNAPYIPACPKEIYIGMKCLPMYKDRLIKIAQILQIPIHQMIFDELSSDYNLIPKMI
ncbi:MAG TPA: DUF2971 domain-containing protein [Syntrophomonas sp.]|nr:DUF2971 domain-containing protein [Syntrophomonas sp.]